MQTENEQNQERFMKLPEVLSLIPLSRSSWYAGIKTGIHPEPKKIGERSSAWLKSDIDKLIKQLAT